MNVVETRFISEGEVIRQLPIVTGGGPIRVRMVREEGE